MYRYRAALKKLKQIHLELKTLSAAGTAIPPELLWQLICYLPKMPLRKHQQDLVDEAVTSRLSVHEPYFTGKHFPFTVYRWGNGPISVLITHGWASKAADFYELITTLRRDERLTITAFDVPEAQTEVAGELSYMLLFIHAVKAIIAEQGQPRILIGHSLGAMANSVVTAEVITDPLLLISIAPIIRLKENFEDTFNAVNLRPDEQEKFMRRFSEWFGQEADFFKLSNLYRDKPNIEHWLAHDPADRISHHAFLEEFLHDFPRVKHEAFPATGHDRIIRSDEVVAAIRQLVSSISR